MNKSAAASKRARKVVAMSLSEQERKEAWEALKNTPLAKLWPEMEKVYLPLTDKVSLTPGQWVFHQGIRRRISTSWAADYWVRPCAATGMRTLSSATWGRPICSGRRSALPQRAADQGTRRPCYRPLSHAADRSPRRSNTTRSSTSMPAKVMRAPAHVSVSAGVFGCARLRWVAAFTGKRRRSRRVFDVPMAGKVRPVVD